MQDKQAGVCATSRSINWPMNTYNVVTAQYRRPPTTSAGRHAGPRWDDVTGVRGCPGNAGMMAWSVPWRSADHRSSSRHPAATASATERASALRETVHGWLWLATSCAGGRVAVAGWCGSRPATTTLQDDITGQQYVDGPEVITPAVATGDELDFYHRTETGDVQSGAPDAALHRRRRQHARTGRRSSRRSNQSPTLRRQLDPRRSIGSMTVEYLDTRTNQ